MKKIIWPGFVAGIVILILSMSISYLFMAIPSVKADYYNPAIMRQMQDPLMTFFFLYPFIAGIIYSWAWDKSKTLFAGSLWRRGGCFGLAIFLIATIPGMFITYVSMPYSFMTIVSWAFQGFVCPVIAGFIFAKMNN